MIGPAPRSSSTPPGITITRGTPIEGIALDDSLGHDATIYALYEKLNEVIGRINAMNEVQQ